MNIVCLSTRGAGPRLTLDFATIAKQKDPNLKVLISSSNELLKQFKNEFNESQLSIIHVSNKPFLALLNRLFYGKLIFNNDFQQKLEGSSSIFFPMASVWDYYLARALQEKYKIIRIIHDGVKHTGDTFPRNFMIKKQYQQSDRVICLSQFTANVLKKKYPNIKTDIEVTQHPVFSFVSSTSVDTVAEKYVLLVGRNKKYQNFRKFVKNWEMDAELVIRKMLIVAGKNASRIKKKTKSVIYVDRWLSEKEIAQLIANCEVAVFPYSEASQSGLIPIARHFNKPIVFFPIGGLEEQLNGYHLAQKVDNFGEMMEILKNHKVEKIDSSVENWKSTWKNLEDKVYKDFR